MESGLGAPVDSGAALAVAGRVVLRQREEARLLRGHCWVFSNEVARTEGEPPPGSLVEVARADGRPLGLGLYNPASLIAVRLMAAPGEAVDGVLIVSRLRHAQILRRRIYPDLGSLRVVHGESDGLPGLIVDKYEDCLVVQTLSLGMDKLLGVICDALEEVYHPRAILERNESHLREREGLPQRRSVLRGDAPARVVIQESDLRFEVDLESGQKTGFYFDQRENRLSLRRFVSGARVLDAYCQDGGFGLHAARAGASAVVGLDIAQDAVDRARRNAALNGLEGICRFECADALPAFEALHVDRERFDVIILDPPSFTRTRKNVPAAKRGYEEVNRRALRLLRRGGILATASCSFHITDETFMECVVEAAFRCERKLVLLEWRSQAPDHPILPSMPETRYLKLGIFHVE